VKVVVAITLRDFLGMLMMGARACQIAGETGRVGPREVLTEVGHHPGRDSGRINQKSPQKAYGTQLEGHPETMMLASTLGDERAVGIVEMKKARQLGWRGFPGIPPVALGLFIGEKGDWHRCSLSCGVCKPFRKRSLMERPPR
jgi:hypothetical protein